MRILNSNIKRVLYEIPGASPGTVAVSSDGMGLTPMRSRFETHRGFYQCTRRCKSGGSSKPEGDINRIEFWPDGSRLAVSYREWIHVGVYGSSDGKQLWGYPWIETVQNFALSPNGKLLAMATDNDSGAKSSMPLPTGRHVLTLTGHSQSVIAIAWSPDGKRLATGSDDMTVKLWDANTGACLGVIGRHDASILDVRFISGGRTLASFSADGVAKLWLGQLRCDRPQTSYKRIKRGCRMVEGSVRGAIERHLARLEVENGVKVLYAVESGSRAWGFASPDSDFDIRFLYLHWPEWYLSVQKRRDVLEAMADPDLDFAGWDLSTTLVLLRKSNRSLIEWLASPIVYSEDTAFMAEFRELAAECISLNACLKHYLSMASSNWQSYFSEEAVSLKKYLYVLRPIVACRWIERYSTAPPVAFSALLEGAGEPGEVARKLDELLLAKAAIGELGKGPHRQILDRFIEAELGRISGIKYPSSNPVDFEELDRFFRRCGCGVTDAT